MSELEEGPRDAGVERNVVAQESCGEHDVAEFVLQMLALFFAGSRGLRAFEGGFEFDDFFLQFAQRAARIGPTKAG